MEDEESLNKNWNNACLKISELTKRLQVQDCLLLDKSSFLEALVKQHESEIAEISQEHAIILQEYRERAQALGTSADIHRAINAALSQFEENRKEVDKSISTLKEKVLTKQNVSQIQVMLGLSRPS
jgi:SMC interacting uncharacterized protein involved in chromosome segregation